MARALCAAVEEEISSITNRKPNDSEDLSRYEAYIDFLKTLLSGLQKIAEQIERANSTDGSSRRDFLENAAESVKQTASHVNRWLIEKRGYEFVGSTALLGLGTAFLATCGAPGFMALPTVAALMGAKAVTDTLSSGVKKGPGGAQ